MNRKDHGQRGRRDAGDANAVAADVRRPERYRDGDKLRPALFDEEARAEAERWRGIKSAQLRRFYGAVTAFVRKVEIDRGGRLSDTDAQVDMALLKASATYAAARSREHRPIRDYFEHHAKLVTGVESYRDFARHFEAVVAYHKAVESSGQEREG